MSGGGGDKRHVGGAEETDSERRCCNGCCCCDGDGDDDDDDDDEDEDGCCGGGPSRYASAFAWTLVALALASVTFAVAYVTLAAPGRPPPGPSAAAGTAAPAASREFCSAASKDLYWLERVGYVDSDRRASKLMALDNVSARDVHYVFAHAAHVPWLHACSLESAVRAVGGGGGGGGGGGRVNAFVVYGVQPRRRPPDGQPLVSLSSSLAELTARYGGDRLNVVHVNVEECLEWSPFQGVDMSGRPSLAAYAVGLVLVWQFGGTALDAGVVAVRGEVYRAAGPAAEYGDRTVSAAAACHAFVYDAMLCARSYALGGGGGGGRRRPFVPDTGRRIAEKTRRWSAERGADAARPVPEWLVCRGGVVGGRCYYVEADRTPLDANTYVRGFCPAVGGTASAASASAASASAASASAALASAALAAASPPVVETARPLFEKCFASRIGCNNTTYIDDY